MPHGIWLWVTFVGGVLILLLFDLLVVHRKPHAVSMREALAWSAFWISLPLAFTYLIHLRWEDMGLRPESALEFLTGYLIEKALSVDNMFVFVVIFRYFAVPAQFQHRVLFWGIMGAVIMRGIFILIGAVLIQRLHAIIYVFGAFLLWTAHRLWKERGKDYDLESNRVVQWGRRNLPLTESYVGQRFFVRRGERWLVTPLFLVLLTVEFTDVVFAVDSIPAIFGITRDPFIVFSSNIFAILGLRALYFVLADIVDRFHLLQAGLALVLAFIGAKMVLGDVYHHFVGEEFPITWSLFIVAILIFGSMLLSLVVPKPPSEAEPEAGAYPEGPPVT